MKADLFISSSIGAIKYVGSLAALKLTEKYLYYSVLNKSNEIESSGSPLNEERIC